VSDGAKGLAGLLFEQGTRLASRAASAVMSDPRGREALARAVGAAQRGKARVEEARERLVHAVGLASRADCADVAKRMARLGRRLHRLAEQLDEDASGGERGR